MMTQLNRSDHAVPVSGRTAMPNQSSGLEFGYRFLLYILVLGLVVITCLAGWKWAQHQLDKRTSQLADRHVKAVMVVNATGDVVDAPDKELVGKNVLLMVHPQERAETRDKMAKQRRVQVETDLGKTELVRTPEGRWLGVVR